MNTTHERLLKIGDVEDRVGFKRWNIYRLIRNQEFPKPRRQGKRAVAWRESEINQWIASRPVAE